MKKDININVVVIGGGPAGYSAAFRCSDLGLSTLIVEKYGVLGGTCLNVGCIPSKSLLHLASLIREIQDFSRYNINLGNTKKLDILKVMNWKENIVSNLVHGLKCMAKSRQVKILQGMAKFINKNLLEVTHNDSIYNIQFNYAIIATGSKSIKYPGISYEDNRILDSTKALNLSRIPKNFLIIGAGIIGLEMATIYSSFGSSVDIIDSSKIFFPSMDRDISNFFLDKTKQYFSIKLDTSLIKLNSTPTGVSVRIKNNNDSSVYDQIYENVLISIGRRANTDSLNLSAIGIEQDSLGFIKSDNQMRTNVSNIFAIGDVVGQPMLAHKGIHESHIAAEVISGKSHFFEPIVIPCVAYCDPEIAWTGMMEDQAKNSGISCRSVTVPWKFLGKAISSNCFDRGITKLIVDTNSNRIIGGVIVGKHAGEMLSQISLSIEMGCDIDDLALTIHAHPTLSESLHIAAQLFNGTTTDMINNK
ncbi:dihydrolipoyl dehydrogenase [Buchnera aphidicola]|uniref:Dihydrolipoyl dehydrogenase n=1 Tax=Buchnera aphidicola (Cinara strobi) TaxID=1921549 RepID=A0A3B1E9F0_9GAMM|nr:dihydrolipoyl dehydrogenase [Buchnera aphidicola]VAX76439.1 Dihydrolipoyl dehydrogenase [Buchnera aphidicola (Cinara strobi)]